MTHNEAQTASKAYLLESFARRAKYAIESYYGIKAPSLQSINECFKTSYPYVEEDAAEYDYTASETDSLDTFEREIVLNSIALYFVGLPFPINGDNESYKIEFNKRFLEQMDKHGWGLINAYRN